MATKEKRIVSRSIQKHDLEINWLKATTFVPYKGELIIYDIEVDEEGNTLKDAEEKLLLPEGRTEPYTYARVKIGDGINIVSDLPFVDAALRNEIIEIYATKADVAEINTDAIIDMSVFPTEDIKEGNFYRVVSGKFYNGSNINRTMVCHIVEELPETGLLTFGIGGSGNFDEHLYYRISDDTLWTYMSEEFLQFYQGNPYIEGCEVGWHRAEPFFAKCDQVYNGTFINIANIPSTGYSLLLDEDLYQYQNGWVKLNFIRLGTGDNAEIFNSLSNIASGDYSHAEGYGTNASGGSSHTEGANTKASGQGSHAEGSNTIASGNYSHAEGANTKASGQGSHAEGSNTIASGNYSHAEGQNTTASGDYSHTEGQNTTASGDYSHTEGQNTTASGDYSHTEGQNTTASGDYSHTEGYSTNKAIKITDITASNSVIINDWTTNKFSLAKANSTHIEGADNLALSTCAHAEGAYTIASGTYSHTEGNGTKTLGRAAHAEGESTTASQIASHAEGSSTTASGAYSHAEGSSTTASGAYSHAEGSSTTASSNAAHAEGEYTKASGNNSHAEGSGTIAATSSQHTHGEYNIVDPNYNVNQPMTNYLRGTYVHIVGNGSSDTIRSNAHTLDWEGNAWFAGDVYVKSTSGKNKDDGSKKLATEELVDTKADKKYVDDNFIAKTAESQTITGNIAIAGKLQVQGTTETVDAVTYKIKNNVIEFNPNKTHNETWLTGLAINKGLDGETDLGTYGIMYDPSTDAVKLGFGQVDEENKFKFNINESAPIATREEFDDSWEDDAIFVFDKTTKKFKYSGKTLSSFKKEIQDEMKDYVAEYIEYYLSHESIIDSEGNVQDDVLYADGPTNEIVNPDGSKDLYVGPSDEVLFANGDTTIEQNDDGSTTLYINKF